MLDHDKNILNEDELSKVSGGKGRGMAAKSSVMPTEIRYCKHCERDTTHNVYSGGRPVCSECGTEFIFGMK
jgi:bacteriocin-like protein